MQRQSTAAAVRTLILLAAACCLPGIALAQSSDAKAGQDNPEPKENLTVDLGGGVTMEFVLIHPGSFQMGFEKFGYDEKPEHKVTITKPFYLGKYLVTQKQWECVMGSNPSKFKDSGKPVEQVSWDDCQAFLAKLKKKVPGLTFRLPTEAEWEYACRAGTTTAFSFGDSEASLDDYAWYNNNSGGTTTPGRRKETQPLGIV